MPMPLITAEGVLTADPAATLHKGGIETASALLACQHGSETITLRITTHGPDLTENLAGRKAGERITVTGTMADVTVQNQWARVTVTVASITATEKAGATR